MSNTPFYIFTVCLTLVGGGYLFTESGKYVRNGDVSLWTEHFGNINNPCVLLIHGAGSHRHTWPDDFCNSLVDNNFFVIRYDLRDSGHSTSFGKKKKGSPPHYTFSEMANDAWTVLDAYGIKNTHIIGHSMGGTITEYLLTTHPERIKTATIIATGPTMTPSVAKELNLSERDPEVGKMLAGNRPTGCYPKDRAYWIKCWTMLHGSCPLDLSMMDLYTKQFYSFFRTSGAIKNHISAIKTITPTLAYDLKKVSLPILVIHGTEDKLVPFDHGKKIADLIPNAKFLPLEKAGHMFFNKELWKIITESVVTHLTS